MSTILNTVKPLNIVAVSGGLNHPSKTEALAEDIVTGKQIGRAHV